MILLHFPKVASFEIVSLAYTLLRESHLLTSWISLWRERTELLRKRRQLHSRRRVSLREIYQYFK
jgi:hypothetical protein